MVEDSHFTFEVPCPGPPMTYEPLLEPASLYVASWKRACSLLGERVLGQGKETTRIHIDWSPLARSYEQYYQALRASTDAKWSGSDTSWAETLKLFPRERVQIPVRVISSESTVNRKGSLPSNLVEQMIRTVDSSFAECALHDAFLI